jgi:hypothetical protein
MRKFSFVVSALALAFVLLPAAKADSFIFGVSGSGFTGSGTLAGSSVGAGKTGITSGTFTINGVNGTLIGNSNMPGFAVYSAGAGYNYDYDDIVITSGKSQSLDDYGLLFRLSNGGVVNIWEVGGVYYWNEWQGGAWLFDPAVGQGGQEIDGNIQVTPEPSSLLLLGAGLMLLAGLIFVKRTHRRIKPTLPMAA